MPRIDGFHSSNWGGPRPNSGRKKGTVVGPTATTPLEKRRAIVDKMLDFLAKDFAAHGEQALREFRERHPDRYCATLISLLPQDVRIETDSHPMLILEMGGIDESLEEKADRAALEARNRVLGIEPVLISDLRGADAIEPEASQEGVNGYRYINDE